MEKNKIKIFYISAGRSDYGLIKNGIKEFQKNKSIKCYPIILGAHKTNKFGNTILDIKKDKLQNITEISTKFINNKKNNTINYFQQILLKFNQLVIKYKPNICIITGDRYDMMAISLICVNHNVPIVHFCGGSVTLGSHDDKYRNSISQFSKLHFVETKYHRFELIKKGISKNRIFVIGAPALENLKKIKYIDKNLLMKKLKIDSNKKIILFTFHTETTLNLEKNLKNLNLVLKFLTELNSKEYIIIITYPNADYGYEQIIRSYEKIKKKNIYLIKNLGTEKYYNLLNNSSLMVGNSSSGIIESASFKLPVLNLGDRQKGRYSGRNVLHSNFSISQVKKKFKIATSNKFNQKISKLKNPYRLKINSVNYCKKIISAFKSNKLS